MCGFSLVENTYKKYVCVFSLMEIIFHILFRGRIDCLLLSRVSFHHTIVRLPAIEVININYSYKVNNAATVVLTMVYFTSCQPLG